MKNNIKNILKSKTSKRIVSGLTAFVMAFSAFPIADIGNEIKNLDLFSISASAANNDDANPPDTYEFLHDDENKISITIKDFYKYAKSYSDYPGYHQYDQITIKTSTSDVVYYEREFSGLGTANKPFAGSIEIEANNDVVFNLDAPLFNYVTDTAVLNNGSSLKISRFYGHKIPSGQTIDDTTPLIAKNVVLDTKYPSKAKATWNISVVKPSATDDETLNGTLQDFGGMIGTMADNTQLTLNVTMDQQTGDTSAIAMKSKSDLGLACGLIKKNATLNFSIGASSGGTIRNISSIETSSGDVGGLVGEMESNSTFNYTGSNIQNVSTNIKTSASGYAGGLVGKIDSATVTLPNTTYTINQYISGTLGSGGIFGYYKPKANEQSFDFSNLNTTNSRQNGTGDVGGLFGVLDSDHNFTIDTSATVTSNHADGSATSYGGLIGRYKNTSLSNTLTISNISTNMTKASGKGAASYGGAIGIIDETNAAYVKFDSFTLSNAVNAYKAGDEAAPRFGGLVGKAENAFVDADNVTISVNNYYTGGGLVGDLGNGVLRLTGTTDLSGAKSTAPTSNGHLYGQIVGNRDSALVFAETGWVFKRSAAVSADDIGAWGEVLRFDTKSTDTNTETDEGTGDETTYDITYEQFSSSTVLTVNETAHTITVADSVSTVSSVADFASTALNIKVSSGNIITAGTPLSGDITLGSNIDLRGTGLTGFTRDNSGSDNKMDESHCVFSNKFVADDNGYSITLAIGESYGFRGEDDLSTAEERTEGDGKIYNHRYNGLFGVINGSVIGDYEDFENTITIKGSINVSPKANDIYVGAVAAITKTQVSIYCLDVETKFDYAGAKNIYLGRLIGEVNEPAENTNTPNVTKAIDIYSCNLSGEVSGINASDGTCIGGAIGKIYHHDNKIQNWYFESIQLSGKIENKAEKTNQIVGGLVAMISGYSATSSYNPRTLTLDDIITKNLEISGGKATTMGGLLGYQWLNTNVVVGVTGKPNDLPDTNVTINTNSKITAIGDVKDMAGLVYNATGKWTVNDLDITAINVAASSPRSFGMIVNKGWYCASGKNYKTDGSSSAIYLLLPTTTCYSISSSTLTSLNGASVFDELVAYSAYYTDSDDTRSGVDDSGDEYILKNGAGVVSIKTSETNGLNMNGTTLSNSYKAQTTQGAKPNPWTRYYYNLDTVTSDKSSDLGTAQKKLMSWGLNQYAHQSIRDNFANPFTNNQIDLATYDMSGYSWYPVDVDSNVKVQGAFKFYNYEFEQSEAANGDTYNSQKTSLYNSTKSSTTQHYMLHSSLLRNVYAGKTVTVNNVILQGNTPVINGYSGAFICGTVDGSSDTNKAVINIDGLDLDGVYIHNITNVTGDSITYAPLAINRILKYTNLTVKNVKTTNKYTTNTSTNVPYIKKDGTYPKAGSSLIGEVGSSTAKGLNLNFTKMKLDGRTAAVDDTNGENTTLNNAYGTDRTIFTKATLLDKFEFESGSTGTYTYTWANDWGSDGRYVTYGKEVGYTNEGEYPGIERQYIEGSSESAAEYTSPMSNADANGNYMSTNKNNFLPYVATAYTSNGTKHQLEVNHRTTTAEGCGTYNDPYLIQNGSDLENFAKILNGICDGTSVILPSADERAAYWCDDKSGKTKHKVFTFGGTTFDCEGETSLTTTQVRTYLAGAYYKLGKSIDLNITYPGLSSFTSISTSGATRNDFAVFRGVIDGGGYTITNKSTSPLIGNSYGSVVKNLTISVESAGNIQLNQTNNTEKFPTCKSYGGVISNVLGGDNIIDNVSVSYASMQNYIDLEGANNQLIPVGGYIGVIVSGCLIFKNMNDKPQGIASAENSIVITDYKKNSRTGAVTYTDVFADNWLYVNPIIGRVLNGYAVTEGSDYVTSEDDVTMHNGTKNYSIADIKKTEENKLSTSAYTAVTGATTMYSTDVSIPNAQALFVMSLLTQSSTTVGAPSTLVLGVSDSYDGTYHRMRCAAYSAVGTNAANDNKPADYTAAVTDEASTGVPFLVKNYTDVISGTTSYGVLALTNNNTVCNLNLGGTEKEWTLPDGFRGIGSIGFDRTDLTNRTISLHKFSGKNNNGAGSAVTITMNMSLQHYEADYDNYLPVNSGNDTTGCIGGLGLFNTLHHNRKDQGDISTDYKISDLNITGNINYFVFKHDSADGTATYTSSYVHNNAYLNVGGIAGYAGMLDSDSIKVEVVGVSGLTVNGFETAGGFFGNLQLKNEAAAYHQVTISNIIADTAFTVTSKRYSGGIIGYFKQGNLNINTVTIKMPNVINEYRGSSYQDFLNGAGGVIGFAQTGNTNAPMVLTGITLGQQNTAITSRIGYKDGSTFFCNSDKENGCDDTVVAGGIIGRSYTIGNTTENGIQYSLKLENCNVYNISLYGHRVGGLIGADIGASGASGNGVSYLAFLNCEVISDQESTTIKGITDNVKISKLQHRASGGIIGGARAKKIIVDSCIVKGYTFWGYNDTAGVCGNLEEADIFIRNFTISDVVFKSDYAASLVGWLNKPLQGYNILCDNIQFQDKSGGTKYIQASHGYLVAKRNGSNPIKIAGLSIQNATPKSSEYFIPPRLSGTGDYNGNNGYIIFADYNGTASDSNKLFSDINDSTNVKDYNNQDVTDNSPYVTSSPKMFIGTDQFLTGDAVSSTSYAGSAFEQIILDKQDPQKSQNGAQSFQTAPAVDAGLLKDVTDHLTTSREEFGTSFSYNFPMLIVEDSDKAKVTNYINYYIQTLTNSPSTFTFQQDKTSNNISNIYKVTLHKCTYNKDSGAFTVGAAGTGSLQRYNTGFQMDAAKIDNADPNTPQFTLMDVQFLNPSSNAQVAYHLYVPIYVKKMIQYKFNAEIASGTNYYSDAYASITSKTLFENLGNPVTMRIEYTYDRDTTDWAEAINGGENVLDGSNFFKELKMSMNSNGWAPDSRLVLVDSNNNDKHYYLDSSIVTADANGVYHIPFDSFTTNGASGGTAYKPVPLSSLLEYTITATNNGPLIVTTDATKATVKSPDGRTMYMPRPNGNTAQGYTAQGYTATVTKVNPEVYYLSFFTNKNSGNDKIYHYVVNSLERFEQHSTDNTNWKPNKIIRAYNDPVHLIIGNLYTNNTLDLTVTPRVASTYKMSKSNNVLTVTMTSHISLTQAAKDEKIWQNLNENPNSTIYQTFLMNYDMMKQDAPASTIGVDTSAIQSITVTDYRIYYGLTVPNEEADLVANPGEDVKPISTDPEELMNSNYIELRNNKNLNEYLKNSTTGHDNAATIQVTFAIEYAEKNLTKQFPERKDESDSTIGSLVRGFSNISSVAESGAYSATSLKAEDSHRYYTTNLSSANLTYNAEKTPSSPNGQYSSLGINPFDEQTAKVVTNKGHIDSTAIYSYIDLVDPGDYIEFNLTLTSKKDGYDRTPLVLGDYLNNLTIKAGNTTLYTQGTSVDNSQLKASISSDGKTLTLRAHKSQLKELADKIYTIDISYDVLTGEANGFGSTKAYSNYKVTLTADIYAAIDTTASPDNPTHDSDHIIYTNSKLQYSMIS